MEKPRSNHELIHQFASLPDAEKFTASARSGNVFFERGVLYSYGYHFIIARYYQTKKDGIVVLWNTEGYSNSTSKHQSIAASALSQYEFVRIPTADTDHEKVWRAFERETKPHLLKLATARKPIIYLDAIARLQTQAEKFARATGTKIPASLKKIFKINSKESAAKVTEFERKQLEKQRREAEARRATQDAESIALWRSFERSWLSVSTGLSYLRINTEHQRIETSQRIEIGFLAARRLFEAIRNAVTTKDYTSLLGVKVLDHYTIKDLTAKYIRIGCHKIEHSEINSIAEAMDWIAAGTIKDAA